MDLEGLIHFYIEEILISTDIIIEVGLDSLILTQALKCQGAKKAQSPLVSPAHGISPMSLLRNEN